MFPWKKEVAIIPKEMNENKTKQMIMVSVITLFVDWCR